MNLKNFAFVLVGVGFFSAFNLFALEKREIIRVGYYPNDDLVENIDNQGNEGFGYEVLKKIEEISNYRFEFIEVSGSIFDALENNEVDVIGLFFRLQNREESFLYVDVPFNSAQMSLVANKDLNIPYDDPQSINGKVVATYHDNPANEDLDMYLAEHNIEVTYVLSDFYNYRDMQADFYLSYSTDKTSAKYETILNLSKQYTYLMTRKDDQVLAEGLKKTLSVLILEEGLFFNDLITKYYDSNNYLFHRNLRANEIALLRARPLRVGYEENNRPFAYTNSEGKADGAIVAALEELVTIYDFDVEYCPYSLTDPDSFPADCDVIISAIGDRNQQKDNFTITEEYYEEPMIAIVPKKVVGGNESVLSILSAAPKIGISQYLYQNFDEFLSGAPGNKVVFFNTFDDLLKSYKKREVDMAVFTESGLPYANSYLNDTNSYILAADFTLKFCFAIANDIAQDFVPIFNVMFDNVPTDRYDELLVREMSAFYYQPSFLELLVINWYYVVIFALIVTVLFIFIALQIKKENKKIMRNVYKIDVLTGLMSMDYCRESLIKVLQTAQNDEYELISFDIDLFKAMNLYLSVEKGNEVILAIGNTLKSIFTGETDYISRKTADQFLVLRKANSTLTMEKLYYEYIRPSIQTVVGTDYRFTVSFGNIIINDCSEKVSAIIGYADVARLQGKAIHENTFITFDSTMRKTFEDKISVTLKMEQALKDKEFVVVYQPKIDFKNLSVGGAEALVRWRPKEGSQIFPDAFIPVFEENGFIFHLDMYVLENVCKFIVENYSRMSIPRISVNLSANSILHDSIVASIKGCISKHGLLPSEIELEVTESAIIEDGEKFILKVKELKKMGFLISIDDFGAGGSSLNRLGAIKADVLKLDKAFFDEHDSESKMSVVVADVIKMAKGLKMSVVAEGVETIEQAKWLKDIDCDYAQGYYFARPMEKSDFVELLLSKKIYKLENGDSTERKASRGSGINSYG